MTFFAKMISTKSSNGKQNREAALPFSSMMIRATLSGGRQSRKVPPPLFSKTMKTTPSHNTLRRPWLNERKRSGNISINRTGSRRLGKMVEASQVSCSDSSLVNTQLGCRLDLGSCLTLCYNAFRSWVKSSRLLEIAQT